MGGGLDSRGTPMTTIVREGAEDLVIRIRRVGRRIICTTDRPGVASSIERTIIKALAPKSDGPSAIGFRIYDQEE
jgi:hypothetical protein